MMKAREIRSRLQGKVEPELVVCLTALAESLSSQQQEIMALAELINKITDITMSLGATIESATNVVDKIRGTHE
jgi:glutamine synthetase type III